MKKILVSLTSFVIIFGMFSSNNIYAEENLKSNALLEIKILEETENFDTSTEIIKYITELKTQLNTEENIDERNKIIDLIATLEEIKYSVDYLELSVQNEKKLMYIPTEKDIRNTFNASAAAIIAYFKYKGYDLSADLLTHGLNNSVVNSRYTPRASLTSQIYNTPQYKSIKSLSNRSGSERFTSGDLYYAINKFNYSTSGSGGLRTLSINDRYDFEWDTSYPKIQGVAVNAMKIGQTLGYLKPYTIYITKPVK